MSSFVAGVLVIDYLVWSCKPQRMLVHPIRFGLKNLLCRPSHVGESPSLHADLVCATLRRVPGHFGRHVPYLDRDLVNVSIGVATGVASGMGRADNGACMFRGEHMSKSRISLTLIKKGVRPLL